MAEITVDFAELEALGAALEAFPERVDEILLETMEGAEGLAREELTNHPDPPTEVHWDSPEQQRAFHRSRGFGGGDPYIRVGNLDDALRNMEPVQDASGVRGGVFAIENWVRFVLSPEQQSNIHRGRWLTDAEKAEKIRPDVVRLFDAAIKRAVAEFKINGQTTRHH